MSRSAETANDRSSTRPVLIKLQTVQVSHVDVELERGDITRSLGHYINTMITGAMQQGHLPNKLVIDLNPPREEDLARME